MHSVSPVLPKASCDGWSRLTLHYLPPSSTSDPYTSLPCQTVRHHVTRPRPRRLPAVDLWLGLTLKCRPVRCRGRSVSADCHQIGTMTAQFWSRLPPSPLPPPSVAVCRRLWIIGDASAG